MPDATEVVFLQELADAGFPVSSVSDIRERFRPLPDRLATLLIDWLPRLSNPSWQETIAWSLLAAGKRTLLSMADGTRTSFTFDSADRLLSQYNIHANSSVKSGVDYEYDPAGNRNRMRDAAGESATWTYDDSYQLIREQRTAVTGTFDTTFTYDPVGNRTAKNALGSLTTSTYDAADQLQTAKDSSGTTTFTFDASGNQQIENAPGGITTHSWNYENQRIGIVQPSGSRVTMAYNADFFRVRKEA